MTAATSCHTREVRHEGLGRSQVISGPDETLVEAQASALVRTWQHEYTLGQVQNILPPALEAKHALDWEKLKRTDPYSEAPPAEPVYHDYPPEPQPDDPRYWPTPGQTEILDKSLADQKKRAAHELYTRDYAAWGETVRRTEAENQRRYADSFIAVEHWKARRLEHRQALASENAAIEKRKADYEACLPAAVVDYFKRVLSASHYPENLPRDFDLAYIAETKTLILEQALPAPASLPRVKAVKYVKSRREFVEVPLPKVQFGRFYDRIVYQICLRRLHELFDADVAGALSAVIFNGWVETTATASGEQSRVCVLSVRAGRTEFQTINLRGTDPGFSFKLLQPAASSKPYSLAPVVRLQTINCGHQPAHSGTDQAPTQ